MEILVKGTFSEHGNCKEVGLVKTLGVYAVITAKNTDTNHIDIDVNPNFTCDLMEALHIYEQATGCDLTEYIKR